MTPYLAKKKEEKRKNLLNSAHKLFASQGISGTSISQICEEAKVAKGTFYLYFENKDEILRALNVQLSYDLLKDAYGYSMNHRTDDFTENAVIMAHYLIQRFRNDIEMVKMMNRDFIWPVKEADFMDSQDELIVTLRKAIQDYAEKKHVSLHSLLVRFFSGISMICSVSYSCLIDHSPCELDDAEPEIYNMIRLILNGPSA